MNKWYEKRGAQDDIVLSSRVRLARNLKAFPFVTTMTASDRQAVNRAVKEAIAHVNLGDNTLAVIAMDDCSEMERYAMVEAHSISADFAKHPTDRILLRSKDDAIAVMVGEEDHLRIQVLAAGLQLRQAYEYCNKLDDVLDETLQYAFDETLGYLTTCPTNLGTGLRASVMMHLPALEQSGMISSLAGTIGKLGLTIRGTFGEGSQILGSMYQISNQITLGITEEDSIQNLESIIHQIIESEQQARAAMLEQPLAVEDAVFRSFGTLQYARKLSGKEFYQLYSQLRLGVSMGLLETLSLETLNRLLQETGAASICHKAGRLLSEEERDERRSQLVRTLLKNDQTR